VLPKKKLLCVDDEPVGLSVRKLFLEHQGYEVQTAEAGSEGLAAFREQEFDAVVLDYYMPDMNGGTVARAMRKSKPGVPIILLSAYLTLPEPLEGSVDAFVVKGESPEVLLAKIAQLTGKPNC